MGLCLYQRTTQQQQQGLSASAPIASLPRITSPWYTTEMSPDVTCTCGPIASTTPAASFWKISPHEFSKSDLTITVRVNSFNSYEPAVSSTISTSVKLPVFPGSVTPGFVPDTEPYLVPNLPKNGMFIDL